MNTLRTDFIQLNRLRITFERSWSGPHSIGVSRPHQRLNERCDICWTEYAPDDRVLILSCSHGYHETCFNQMQRKICPYDQTSQDGISKIELLGMTFLFPGKAQVFARKLSEIEPSINQHLQIRFQTQYDKNPELLQMSMEDEDETKILKKASRVLEKLVQGFLDIYGKDLEEEQIQRCQADFENFLEEHKEAIEIIFQSLPKSALLDLLEIRKKIEDLSTSNSFLIFIQLLIFEVGVDPINLDKAFSYWERILKSAQIRALFGDLDMELYLHHFKKIRSLPTDVEKYGYLRSLSASTLTLLKNYTQGKGPTSLAIQKNIKKILHSQNGSSFSFMRDFSLPGVVGMGLAFAFWGYLRMRMNDLD